MLVGIPRSGGVVGSCAQCHSFSLFTFVNCSRAIGMEKKAEARFGFEQARKSVLPSGVTIYNHCAGLRGEGGMGGGRTKLMANLARASG